MDISSIYLIILLSSLVEWVVGLVDVVAAVVDVAVGTHVDAGANVDPMGIPVMGIDSLLTYFSYTSLSISISISFS